VDETTFDVLEFGSVIGTLAGLAQTGPGRELALRLGPLASVADVNKGYSELREASLFLEGGLNPPLSGITELTPLFKKPGLEGAYLLPEELLRVGETLGVFIAMRVLSTAPEYLAYSARLPIITAILSSIETPASLKRTIDMIIDSAGEIRDEASTGLLEIRRNLRNSKQSCRNIYQRFQILCIASGLKNE